MKCVWTPACGKLEQLRYSDSTASHITKWSDWRVMQYVTQDNAPVVDSSWNVMAHGDAREGKWKENWCMEWVASSLHTTSGHGISSITTADAHTLAASSRLNWRPPADLNGLVRFTERRNLVSAHVLSHFNWPLTPNIWWAPYCRSIPDYSWYFSLVMKCCLTSVVLKALFRLVTLNIYAYSRLIPYAVAILPPAFGVWIV